MRAKMLVPIVVALAMMISGLLVGAGPVRADVEPNDTFGDAEEITEGSYSGNVNSTDEKDVYKISLQPSSIISIDYTSQATTNSEQVLRFYNPSRDQKFSLSSKEGATDSGEYYLSAETEADYWFIEVEADYGSYGEYSFEVVLSSQDDAGSGEDVPAAFGDALEITEGEYTGIVMDEDDKDTYKCQLQPGSIVGINYTSHATTNSEQVLRFYDPSREKKFSLNSKEGLSTSGEYYLSAENGADHWFVRVEADYGSYGAYSFEIEISSQDDAGSGEDVPAAFDDALEITEGEYSGIVMDEDDEDTYKIHIQPGSIVGIDYTSEATTNSEQVLKFYDPSREKKFSLKSKEGLSTSGEYYLSAENDADHWFVSVEADYGSYGAYSFEIDLSSQDDAGTGVDAPSDRQGAPTIQPGEDMNGVLMDEDETDMFALELTAGDIVMVNYTSQSPADAEQELYLLDPDNNEVVSLKSKQGTEKTGDHVLSNSTPAGMWHITVEAEYGSYGAYSFDIDVDRQNDAGIDGDAADAGAGATLPESATAISTGSFDGYLREPEDVTDVYTLELLDGEALTVDTDPQNTLSLDIYLYDDQFTSRDEETDRETGVPSSVGFTASADTIMYIWMECDEGYGTYSLDIEVTTAEELEPVTVEVSEVTGSSVELSWSQSEVSDLDRYEIYMSPMSGSLGERFETVEQRDTTTVTVENLPSESSFYFTIRVVNTAGTYADSDQVEATTLSGDDQQDGTGDNGDDQQDGTGDTNLTDDEVEEAENIIERIWVGGVICIALAVIIPLIIVVVIIIVVLKLVRSDKGGGQQPPQQPTQQWSAQQPSQQQRPQQQRRDPSQPPDSFQ